MIEKPRANDSNDLVIRDHLRELRVIKDLVERFDVSQEEAKNSLASHHQIRIPEVQVARGTLRQYASKNFQSILSDRYRQISLATASFVGLFAGSLGSQSCLQLKHRQLSSQHIAF